MISHTTTLVTTHPPSLSNPRAQLLLAACSQFTVHSPVHKCCTSRALDRGSGCAPQAQRPGPSSGWRRAVTANAHAAKRSKPVRSMLTSAVSSRAARSLQQHDARLTPREPRQHCTVGDFSAILPAQSRTCSRSRKAHQFEFMTNFNLFAREGRRNAPIVKKVR